MSYYLQHFLPVTRVRVTGSFYARIGETQNRKELMEMDAILGGQVKWSEVYKLYIERHFMKSDNEVRHLRKFYPI